MSGQVTLCACGCGRPTEGVYKNSSRGQKKGDPRKWITGHWPKREPLRIEAPNPTGLCFCGCGEKTPLAKYTRTQGGYVAGKPTRYLKGHASRVPTADVEPLNESGLCQCGCGGKAPLAPYTQRERGFVEGQPLRFIRYHHQRRTRRGPLDESRYTVTDLGYSTPCWIWNGRFDRRGYGSVWNPATRKLGRAHRVMYEERVGPIPEGLVLDHLCSNPSCLNPEHLEPVTQKVNVQRAWAAKRAH